MSASLAIVDFGLGNLCSVQRAISYIGVKSERVSDPDRLAAFSHILLPGVGSFRQAMQEIHALGFDQALHERVMSGIPVLGICLGMQLLARQSTEDGTTQGLAIIECDVDKFSIDPIRYPTLKIPHVGFNSVSIPDNSRLFSGMNNTADFYFTHSYRIESVPETFRASTCQHGTNFIAALESENIAATQFHPEKSQANGLKLLRNFIEKF